MRFKKFPILFVEQNEDVRSVSSKTENIDNNKISVKHTFTVNQILISSCFQTVFLHRIIDPSTFFKLFTWSRFFLNSENLPTPLKKKKTVKSKKKKKKKRGGGGGGVAMSLFE